MLINGKKFYENNNFNTIFFATTINKYDYHNNYT